MNRSEERPDLTRPDAGTILVSRWNVSTPQHQRAAAEATLGEWDRADRPDAMLALYALLSLDGDHVLYYAQWTDDEAHEEFVRTKRPELVRRIDAGVPGIERPGLTRYRLHRSCRSDITTRPGLVVGVRFETDGPVAQKALADLVVERLEAERVPGMISANFHLSKDGTKVLNYAEWTDEDAYHAFTAGTVSPALRESIDEIPGVRPKLGELAQYRMYGSVVNIPAG
ncbi:antibiotic biosynthesis monooxygenase [Allokutzneria oryzae]|uniref:Antibiotic biosynthesis monooxygenase n=1 Tax=Allokutzneria oryzae TaxID=1378989 RepID=A0ABV6AC32_9PSEU